MTDIMPFTYGDQPVRVIAIDGEPWFILADLAKVLDIADVSRLRSRLDDGVRRTHPIPDALGRTQETTIVNEPGMYEVVLRSDKPEAVAFRRWITSDVLPTIRKTGGYGTPRALTPDEIVHQALQITQARVEDLTAQVEELTPQAAAWQQFMDADGYYTFDAAAKILGTGRVRLMAQLRADNILTRDNLPMQAQLNTGRFVVKVGRPWSKPDGTAHTSRSTRVTAKGLDWLVRKYADPTTLRLILGGGVSA